MLTFLIQILIGSTAILMLAVLLSPLLRRTSAAVRHSCFGSVLIALLVLPLVIPFLPVISLIAPHPVTSEPMQSLATITPVEPLIKPQFVALHDIAAESMPFSREIESSAFPMAIGSMTVGNEAQRSDRIERGTFQFGGHGVTALPFMTAIVLLCGTVIRLAMLIASIVATRNLVQSSGAFEPTCGIVSGIVPAAWCRKFRIRREVPVLTNDRVLVPLTARILRPVILLPASMQRENADRLRLVLMHELAHIARHDVLWQLLTRVMLAAYWWHPLAWLLTMRIRREREFACDDAVLLHRENPEDYASVLLGISKSLRQSPVSLPGCTVTMAQTHQVESRICAILDPNRVRKPLGRFSTTLLILTACTLTAVAGMLSPIAREVAVEEDVIVKSEEVVQDSPLAISPVLAPVAEGTYQPVETDKPQVMFQLLIAEVNRIDDSGFPIKTFSMELQELVEKAALDYKKSQIAIMDSMILKRQMELDVLKESGAAFDHPQVRRLEESIDLLKKQLEYVKKKEEDRKTVSPRQVASPDKPGVSFSASNDVMNTIFDAFEKEKMITILSRPQLMTMDNQLAVVYFGTEEKGMFVGIVPRIIAEDRIVALVSISQGTHDAEKQFDINRGYRFETIATLQENVPLFVSGLMKSDDGETDKEIMLCVTATIVPPVPPKVKEEPTRRVSFKGTVLMPDGTPVKNAEVHFFVASPAHSSPTEDRFGVSERSCTTDENGKYSSIVLFLGSANVRAMCYAELSSENGEPIPFVTEPAYFDYSGESTWEVEHDFTFIAASPVTGVVRYPDGSPAENFLVGFHQNYTIDTGQTAIINHRTTTTDASGRFSLYLPSGEYRCSASSIGGVVIASSPGFQDEIVRGNFSPEQTVTIDVDKPTELEDIILRNPAE